jgi:hypothetical protein
LPHDELDNIFTVKISFLSFKDGNKVYEDFLLFDQVNGRNYFLEHMFDNKAELIHLFSAQIHSKNLARGVIDANEDGTAFSVHEGNNSFEKDSFESFLLDGYGIVFELDSYCLER